MESALLCACRCGTLCEVEEILSGPDKFTVMDAPEKIYSTTYTPLMYACYHKQKDIAEKLISGGASVTYINEHHFTALHYAIQRNLHDIVAMLLATGECDIHAKESLGKSTPLMLCCENSDLQMLQLLVDNGAATDVNVERMNGGTCLHEVCYRDNYVHHEMVKQMISALLMIGANPLALDYDEKPVYSGLETNEGRLWFKDEVKKVQSVEINVRLRKEY